jgi:parvulin-like peptidyl-prolyl isomerase
MLVQGEKAGLHVSEDSLDRALLTNPAYLENGRFSETLYTRTVSAEKARIRKLAREEALAGLYLRDMFTGLKTGAKEKDFVTAMAKTERSFSLASFPYAGFPEAEIRGFGEANKALFRRIKVSRILVTSGEKEAKEIRRKISEKVSSFEELAKAHSKDGYKDNGGDMGWRYAYDLESDFEKKEQAAPVFALKAGEVSEVAKGGFGWLIYRVDAEPVDPDFADAAVLDVVKSYLVTYEKGKIEDYFVAKAQEFSRRAGEAGFAAAARQAGITPVATDFFPINLQNVFSFTPLKALDETATPTTAIYSEEFFTAAFALAKDKVSEPVVLDDQVIVMSVLAEKEMPETTAGLMGSWLEYIASQTMQADLQNQLMDPAKLKDNFMEAFTKLYDTPQKG